MTSMAGGFDLALAPGQLIRRAEQVHTSIWGEVVGPHVTSVQFAILAAIAADPGVDQRTVGERVSLDASTLAEICRRLVARGLVSRERDDRDARRYVLCLTARGEAVLAHVAPAAQAAGRQLLDGLSEDERQNLLGLLGRLALRTTSGEPTR